MQERGWDAHKAACKRAQKATPARADAKAAASGAAVCGPELFSAAFVDEGSSVFAHEPRSWVAAGQHRLAARDVGPALNSCLSARAARLVFADPNQGRREGPHRTELPSDAETVSLLHLLNLRNPGAVRDVSFVHQADPERLLTVQGLQDERVAGRVETREVDMPMDMKNELLQGEHRFMSGRWGNILTESSDDELRRWSATLQQAYAARVASVLVEKVCELMHKAGPEAKAEAVLRHCAVLCPAAVTQPAAQVWERKDRPSLSRSDLLGLRARVRAVLEARAAERKRSLADHKQEAESAAEIAVLSAVQASGSPSATADAGFFFGTVEDFQGLERGLVLVAGFQDPLYVKARLGALSARYNKTRAEVRAAVCMLALLVCCVVTRRGVADVTHVTASSSSLRKHIESVVLSCHDVKYW